jgi:hypothetical protein
MLVGGDALRVVVGWERAGESLQEGQRVVALGKESEACVKYFQASSLSGKKEKCA